MSKGRGREADSAKCGAQLRTWFPWPWDHNQSRNKELDAWLSHPDALKIFKKEKKGKKKKIRCKCLFPDPTPLFGEAKFELFQAGLGFFLGFWTS